MFKRLKFGCHNMINAMPIVYGMLSEDPAFELVRGTPAGLAGKLVSGELDVAIIPSVEYLHHPEYVIASPVCIAAREDVMSVKLYSRKPPGEIRTLALDDKSLTSARLVRIILQKRYGAIPRCSVTGIYPDLAHIPEDAILIIGDEALTIPEDGFTVFDLAREWRAMTGLSFVFALCCCRRGAELGDLPEVLADSLSRGLAGIDNIVGRIADSTPIPRATLERYFANAIHYNLGPDEALGLRRYYAEIVAAEMWHEDRELEYL